MELEPIAEPVAGNMELEPVAELVVGKVELEPVVEAVAGTVAAMLGRIEPVGGVPEGIVGVVELLLPNSIRIVYTHRISVMDACIVMAIAS